jgi:two-component system sensor histidine kinase/response regulator
MMTSNERGWAILESLYRAPVVNYPELAEALDIPENEIPDTLDHLRRSQEELHMHITTLQVRNMELEAYAHMVAHDLKDPLAVIVATSDLVTDVADLTGEELKEYLRQIRSNAYGMNRIIDNLMLFAEVSKTEVPVEPVDMAEVVANVRDRLSYMIKEYQAKVGLPEAWPGAFGYAPWIEEVWANYLSNALKHGGQPPRVELGASTQPDGMVRFWTRDNGPGLPPEAQASLFMPFNQISHAGNPGHGLGLSITHDIVEKLGGQVGVESEVGQGSLFYFTLPTEQSSTR